MANFQFLIGITGGEKLYYDANIWFRLLTNYWKCVSCKAHLSTKGDSTNLELKYAERPLPKHLGHEPVSEDEFKIRSHFHFIKNRITNELDKWPSTIFKEETINLQTEQKVSKLAIALYVKP